MITARATAAPSANPCHHPCPPIIVCQRSCHPPWSIVALEACSLPWLEKSTRVPPLFHQLQLVNPTAINENMRTKVPTVNISYKSYQQEMAKACIRLVCLWAYVVCFVWAIGIWSTKYFYWYIVGCQHSSIFEIVILNQTSTLLVPCNIFFFQLLGASSLFFFHNGHT